MKNNRNVIIAVLLGLSLLILNSCLNVASANNISEENNQTTDLILSSSEMESIEPTSILDLTKVSYERRSNVTLNDIKLIYQECEQFALTYEQIILPDHTIRRVLTEKMVNTIQSDTVSDEACLKHLNNVRMLFNFRLAQELDDSVFFLEPYGTANDIGYCYVAVIFLNTETTPFQSWWAAIQHSMLEKRDYDMLTFYYANNMGIFNIFPIEKLNLLEKSEDQRQSLSPSDQTSTILNAIETKLFPDRAVK